MPPPNGERVAPPDGDPARVDLVVVGAGPAGLYAAYYAGFRGLSVAVVDELTEAGGQVTTMYQEKMIYDVAGFPEIRGRDLVRNLLVQADQYRPVYLLGRRAERVHHRDTHLVLELSGGGTVRCGAIVVTGGMGSFTPRPLPAARGFTGTGVLYFVPDPGALAGQDVIVVGGGDSALDWVVSLHQVARSVTLVHRRDRFRAHAGTLARARDLRINMITNATVQRLIGVDRVEAVEIAERGQPPRTVPAGAVVAALGFVADLGPLASWGLRLHGRHIAVDTRMATNLDRVFAAGDITDYPGKVRLIAVGFGEAAIAVNNAAVVLDPAARLFPGHSSDAG